MKSTPKGHKRARPNDLRSEYRFDYNQARPNRFAKAMGPGTVAVVLDPDVAAVFHSSQSVNVLLRSVIKAVPQPGEPSTRRSTAENNAAQAIADPALKA
jgi:hypothetical protein